MIRYKEFPLRKARIEEYPFRSYLAIGKDNIIYGCAMDQERAKDLSVANGCSSPLLIPMWFIQKYKECFEDLKEKYSFKISLKFPWATSDFIVPDKEWSKKAIDDLVNGFKKI